MGIIQFKCLQNIGFFHIKENVLFPHRGKELCIHLRPSETWFELRYSRLKRIQLFPGTENNLPANQKLAQRSKTEMKTHYSGNGEGLITFFYFYVGSIKRKKTLWFTYIHANTFLILYIKYLCISNQALLRKMTSNNS